ncbi:MAG: hypothetical protein HZA66_03410 [Rhodopseudomonas palustris]|uniref:Glucuronosyltransferase GumK N-terminal domain-containing protein n=1 Tax=Rhodopseudomonas palustris TaxID=1076 RepID=A0A933VU93_RHOPL|nr:hypothetical protein [Rhodopseudomonas palustris]
MSSKPIDRLKVVVKSTIVKQMKIAIVSYQIATSRKRTSFHFIAEGMHEIGWDVRFITTGISRLDQIQRRERWYDAVAHGLNTLRIRDDRFASYVHCPLVHPKATSTAALKELMGVFTRPYQRSLAASVVPLLNDSDVVLLESCDGVLMLNEKAQAYAADALIAYRPSDLLTAIGIHRSVLDSFLKSRSRIDRVFLPSALMRSSDEIAGIDPDKISVLPHGTPRVVIELRGKAPTNPFGFSSQHLNVMTVGGMSFDSEFVSSSLPLVDEYTFHLFGELPGVKQSRNVLLYGEQKYEKIVAQAASADVGAAFYKAGSPSYLLETSNKIRIFQALGKPVVCPFELDSAAESRGLFSYSPHSIDSFRASLGRALKYKDKRLEGGNSWDDTCRHLSGALMDDLEARKR